MVKVKTQYWKKKHPKENGKSNENSFLEELKKIVKPNQWVELNLYSLVYQMQYNTQ